MHSKRIAALLAALGMIAVPARAADLLVEVKNVKVKSGNVRVALYARDGFLKKPVSAESLAAGQETVAARFQGLAPGEYAVSAYQDANNNEKLDTNFLGIPNEPYGISRAAKGRMGPPEFEDAKVSVGEQPQTVVLKLK